MSEPLDDLYLPWLYSQVGARSVREQDPSRTHWRLLRRLYDLPYIWIVDRDENRAEDGRALRYEWADEACVSVGSDWLMRGCSFLEMLIALSRRLAFEGDGHPHVWFWHLLNNIDLTQCNDSVDYNLQYVDNVVDMVNWRTYDRHGHGGLFPLRRARRDQRNAELWYQMNAYLLSS